MSHTIPGQANNHHGGIETVSECVEQEVKVSEPRVSARKLAELLNTNGLTANEAKVLVCVSENAPINAMLIETKTRLRQPEVSIALKGLRANYWLKFKAVKPVGKGRPTIFWTLSKSFAQIVQEIVDIRAAEIKGLEDNVIELMNATSTQIQKVDG